MIARAELIPDGGAGAHSDDFFRAPEFLAAEGTTHTLRLERARWAAAVPLIVREIEGSERRDATSPYGYPGGLISGEGTAPRASEVDWSPTGLVSIFARERLGGEPWLAGARERSAVFVHDPALARRVRPRLAAQVRSARRRGWTVDVLPGLRAGPGELEAFATAYDETMRRTGAADRYFFAPDYLRRVLSYERTWLLLARSPAGEPGAGAIVVASDGLLHYYLGGTAEQALPESPFKVVVVAMLDFADERGMPLNLGGGVTAGDGLEAFKRGFANSRRSFRTHEVVCDPVAYEQLSAGAAGDGYFPAYRAP